MTYQIVRTLHVLGALAMFTALGVELAALRGLSSARTADQARGALEGHRINAAIGPVATVLVLLPGLYMAGAAWGAPAWLLVSLAGLVFIVVLGAGVTRKQLAAIGATLQADGDRGRPATAENERTVALLWWSFLARALVLAAIVLLMSLKPGAPGAMLTLGAVGAIATVGFLPIRRHPTRRRAHEVAS